MRARPARDRAGLRGRRGYPAWRRHVRVNSAPLCARPCAGHMRYADSNHLRNSPRRQEVSPLFLCEDSVAGRGGGFPVSPIHPTTQPESEPRAELTLTCAPSWPAAASLSLTLVSRWFEKNLPRESRDGPLQCYVVQRGTEVLQTQSLCDLYRFSTKIKYPPPFLLGTLQTANGLAVSLTG